MYLTWRMLRAIDRHDIICSLWIIFAIVAKVFFYSPLCINQIVPVSKWQDKICRILIYPQIIFNIHLYNYLDVYILWFSCNHDPSHVSLGDLELYFYVRRKNVGERWPNACFTHKFDSWLDISDSGCLLDL